MRRKKIWAGHERGQVVSWLCCKREKKGLFVHLISGKEMCSVRFCGTYLCAINSEAGVAERGFSKGA